MWFWADVTVLRRQGGLYRLDVDTGQRTQVLPVDATILGEYWSVVGMAILKDNDTTIVVEELSTRGEESLRLSAVSLDAKRRLFTELIVSRHFITDIHLLVTDRFVGVVFVDLTENKLVRKSFEIRI